MSEDERRDVLSRRYWWMLNSTHQQIARLEELLADSPVRLVDPITRACFGLTAPVLP
jgi:hypothetical protein